MDSILVTGATGFIGRPFIDFLSQKNLKIRALVRKATTSLPLEIEIIPGDLSNLSAINGICTNIDTVFHLAGYAHVEDANPKLHHEVNYLGTKNLLIEAKRAGVQKFIFFSSVKAVGDSENLINENWDAMPKTPYGIAKRQAEAEVLACKDNMHVCVLRPSLVYGPDLKGNLSSMLNAIKKKYFPPPPNIKNIRSMVSLNDLFEAAWLAGNNPNANGKTYIVTDDFNYSTRDLYLMMCDALNHKPPSWTIPFWIFKFLSKCGDLSKHIFKKKMPFDSDTLTKLFGNAHYSSEKIQQELGFIPQYNLKKLLPQIVNGLGTLK